MSTTELSHDDQLVLWKKTILQQLLLVLNEEGSDKIVMMEEQAGGDGLAFYTFNFSLDGDYLATADAACPYPMKGT